MRYGTDIRAYYVKTQFQPAFELADARRLAQELGARLTVLFQDALADERVAENPKDRCYHCKRALFDGILRAQMLPMMPWIARAFGRSGRWAFAPP